MLFLFARRLKELREEKGLYQKTLSEKLSISRSTITSYESGKRNPDIFTLIKIADLFNVSIDYLLGRTAFKQKACFYFEALDEDLLNIINTINLNSDDKQVLKEHILFAKEQIEKHKK